MKSLYRIRLPAGLALALALLALPAPEARAADTMIQSWRYPTGLAPQSRAEPRLMGPGGATKIKIYLDQIGPEPQLGAIGIMSGVGLTPTVLVPAPGCTTAATVAVEAEQPADDDTVTFTWGYECVTPGDCVTLQFVSAKGPLVVRRSYWGNASQDSIAPTEGCARIPGAHPLGVGALTALIALVGAWVMTRRRGGIARA